LFGGEVRAEKRAVALDHGMTLGTSPFGMGGDHFVPLPEQCSDALLLFRREVHHGGEFLQQRIRTVRRRHL
jgi:hypothetical protein